MPAEEHDYDDCGVATAASGGMEEPSTLVKGKVQVQSVNALLYRLSSENAGSM